MKVKMNKNRLFFGKKISVIFFLLFTCLTLSWAEAIDETEARQKAQAFLADRGVKQTIAGVPHRAARSRRAAAAASMNYYIFNVGENQGFVIVSGDDRTAEILGYADRGSINEETMSPELRAWLQDYSDQIDWVAEHATQTAATSQSKARSSSATVRAAIKPLIESRWDQDDPYNMYCPVYKNKKDKDEHSVTGCAATSMAQIMYYHKYPTKATTAIPAYTSTSTTDGVTHTTSLAELLSTTFDWNKMTATYNKNSTDEAKQAVGKLMQYCGQALQMQYDLAEVGGSAAFSGPMPYVLINYFGYDNGVNYVQRASYNYQEWIDLIYTELANARPVIYNGQSCGGGHSFVCDGYDADDYFHINWGWGGQSDGYYRLSVLSPNEQGIGGSSTLDGFSSGQDAIIGIQPPTATPSKGHCLMLSELRFGDDADKEKTVKEITRNTETGNFEERLYVKVYNIQFLGKFQYAVQLVDGSGEVKETLFCDQNIEYYNLALNGSNEETFDAVIPSSVGKGTYYIKVVSRPYGTETWKDCFLGDRYQLTVTISDDVMTIQVPRPQIQAPTIESEESITVSGNLTVGCEQEVIARLTARVNDFSGDISLFINNKQVMAKCVNIPAGQTGEARFTFVPKTSGDNVLKLKYGSTVLGSKTVTIGGNSSTNTQKITLTPVIANLTSPEGTQLYGNVLRVTATVTNPDEHYAYSSRFACVLRIYNNKDDANDANVGHVTKERHISVPANGSVDCVFDYDGLERGMFYRLRFVYEKGETTEDQFFGPYEIGADGYTVHKADGTFDIVQANGTINAGNALYVDLTGMSTFENVTTFTQSTNPNCLYLLPENATVPTLLNGRNVVCGNTAASVSLTDGHDFFSPIAFTASQMSYTRTFTIPAGGTSGWSTLMLPFKATSVTCEGMGKVDWFHSGEDTGKNFWLKSFTGDAVSELNFGYTDELEANTPYIIAVPGDTWGDSWQMTDKPVTFSATNAAIQPTAAHTLSGNNYKFTGHTMATTQSDVYALNDAGSDFVLATSDINIPAFRAWFSAANINSLNLPKLTIGDGTVNGIHAVAADSAERGSAEWFTLTGVRLSGKPQLPGIYINNGKKIIIK